LAHRRQYGGGRKQDIARACGLHQVPDLSVLDATAGLGRDGFVLASLGAHVHLIERNPLLAALLADGLQRARTVGEPTLLAVLDRLGLSANEALQVPLSVLGQPDVVYLDPMFPAREKSARVKADMQVLHVLLDQAPTTADEDVELMQWALALADKRVVVKRPRLANPLGGHRPDHQLVGKANRFDVYTLKRLAS
ncbi:MAG: class I SAM-dependent methyltransferase, partial [Natronospirillum sp.]